MALTYWEKRLRTQRRLLDDELAKDYRRLIKHYNQMASEVEKDIALFYQRYGENNILEFSQLRKSMPKTDLELMYRDFETFALRNPQYAHLKPTREAIYKLDRLGFIRTRIDYHMANLGASEEGIFLDGLKKVSTTSWKTVMNSSQVNIGGLSDARADYIATNKWFENRNFSQRLWTNKKTFSTFLKNDLKDALIRGDDFKSVVKVLQDRTGIGFRQAKRLIDTETTFVSSKTNALAFQDAGFEFYTYDAVNDELTSDVCLALDGTTHAFKNYKPGLNAPPMHPHCRSNILPGKKAK